MKYTLIAFTIFYIFLGCSFAQPAWQANLDSKIRFYQTTDFGIVLAGTERSLYAVDGQTGERLWRRDTGRIEETAVTPVPDTDVILFSRDLGSKSRLEAVDIMSGSTLWQSDKVKGDVLQLAADPANDLVSVILVKDPRGDAGEGLKRKPIVHVLQLSTGEELWKKEFDGEIEMMPSRFGENLGEIAYTLDNYRAPLMVDGRLFLFYEGATSYDARTGGEKEREKFRVNEGGLALTEADPVIDDKRIYMSGRGRIRAVNRRTGNVEWKADDLGNCAEMALIGTTLFVRTGGQFTRLKDGEAESKGPYGVSAIDTRDGKTIWRFKGADKGLTNFVFSDANTILIADRDDLITIDAGTGKRRDSVEHKIDKAQFVLLNERGDAVVGGRDEIAAFKIGAAANAERGTRNTEFVKATFSEDDQATSRSPAMRIPHSAFRVPHPKAASPSEVWRVRHKPPSRGAFRIIAGIALRATALYFRYGGLATSAIGLARGGLSLASAANSFRWSGLKSRFGSFDLTTLASNSARNYVTRRIYSFGSLTRLPNAASRIGDLQIITPSGIRGRITSGIIDRATPSGSEVRESVIDRLDPVRQIEKLSSYLLRRKRLAELRSNYMYFYTDLPKPFDRKGLIGVNIHTGRDSRVILDSDPDAQFVTDETLNLLYSADGSRLQAFDVMSR
ncbi:MAG TPA: PQQ-binding-like beta-propeller repeat protein [Pyrinomonadaceae bacterium]|nr:PQQ-binding-like beta-propeller repeat protein [Pyrinomonadaceae bacterium]